MGLELEGTGESCGGLTQLTVHIRVKIHIDWFLNFTPPLLQLRNTPVKTLVFVIVISLHMAGNSQMLFYKGSTIRVHSLHHGQNYLPRISC